MSTRVELPDGEHAILKDSDELTNREVKTLRRAARQATAVALDLEGAGFADDNPESWRLLAEMPDEDYDRLDIFQRMCVLLRLESWTVGREMPTTDDEVDDLPRSIYVPLVTAAAQIQLSDEFTLDGAADPKADTGDSAD